MDINYILEAVYQISAEFLNSFAFGAIKLVLLVYVTVLFADIAMLLVLRGLGSDFRQTLRGMDIPITSQDKMMKRWDKITKRLESDNLSQYKAAILEADAIASEILLGIGFKGENMTERIQQTHPGQLENSEDLLRAHETRNRIVQEKEFVINKDEAREIIKIYENFLKKLEFL